MVSEFDLQTHSPAVLEHQLKRHFTDLLNFDSTEEMEGSVVYESVRTEVERILNAVVQENFAPKIFEKAETVRALAWNIERGNRFEGIACALKNHEDLKNKDLLLLTELDYGMARSANRFVAQDLAKELKLNYAFAPCYIALQKGSGIESDVAARTQNRFTGWRCFQNIQ